MKPANRISTIRQVAWLAIVAGCFWSGLALNASAQSFVEFENADFESGDLGPWLAAPQNVVPVSDFITGGTGYFLAIGEGDSAIHPAIVLTSSDFNRAFQVKFDYFGPDAILEITLFTLEAGVIAEPVTIQVSKSSDLATNAVTVLLQSSVPTDLKAYLKIHVRDLQGRPNERHGFIDNVKLQKVTLDLLTAESPAEPPEGVSQADIFTGLGGVGTYSAGRSDATNPLSGDRLLVQVQPPVLVVSQDSLEESSSRLDISVLIGGKPLMFSNETSRDDADSTINIEILDDSGLVRLFTATGVGSQTSLTNNIDDAWPYDLDQEQVGNRHEIYLQPTRVEDAEVQLLVTYSRKVGAKEQQFEIATVVPVSVRSDPNVPITGYDVPSGLTPKSPPRSKLPDERLNRLYREKF